MLQAGVGDVHAFLQNVQDIPCTPFGKTACMLLHEEEVPRLPMTTQQLWQTCVAAAYAQQVS